MSYQRQFYVMSVPSRMFMKDICAPRSWQRWKNTIIVLSFDKQLGTKHVIISLPGSRNHFLLREGTMGDQRWSICRASWVSLHVLESVGHTMRQSFQRPAPPICGMDQHHHWSRLQHVDVTHTCKLTLKRTRTHFFHMNRDIKCGGMQMCTMQSYYTHKRTLKVSLRNPVACRGQ